MRIGVVGAGAWGTSLARVTSLRGVETHLWVRDAERAAAIQEARVNEKYLPGVVLPRALDVTNSLETCVETSDIVIHAVPSSGTRDLAKRYAPMLGEEAIVVSATKGLEYQTNRTMSQIIEEETDHPVVALSGPNHAEEVSRDQPTGTIVANSRYNVAQKVVTAISTPTFKAYAHPDRTGVELCGAYKNVIAIATGMSRGLGYGDNTQAALITLGLHEMSRVLPALGGERRTAYGLAGIGDLIATAGSSHSRNRTFGERVGEGRSAKEAVDSLGGKVVEGIPAAKAFHLVAQENKLNLALPQAVYEV
ncbi:MAG: NAD(P)H-dependent glycerol-3-phosphate dehydrogenase, partial [Candidatus Thermoplasmatota archaeon]|nr:NAD(P)H-dependent glycerol-3-phosphate dehydrogenase [Candidatus Thermoplasmatota archaeon]